MEQITKQEARKEAYKLIKNNDSAISSMIVIKRLIESKILEKYNNIGIYYPIGNEISVIPLVKYYKDKNFYLPITKDKLYFSKYNYLDELVDGPFNTKEPNGPVTSRDEIECFLIPCVAIWPRPGSGRCRCRSCCASYKRRRGPSCRSGP